MTSKEDQARWEEEDRREVESMHAENLRERNGLRKAMAPQMQLALMKVVRAYETSGDMAGAVQMARRVLDATLTARDKATPYYWHLITGPAPEEHRE